MTTQTGASAIASLICLLAAMFTWSIGQESECSAPLGISWFPGLAFFAVFFLLGAYSVLTGDRRQRLALFTAISFVMAGYVWALKESLPTAVSFEITCLAQGARP